MSKKVSNCQTSLSTAPMRFQLDPTAVLNKNVCNNGNIWLRQDPTVVNTESDLLGLTRGRCNKYVPDKSKMENAPVVLSQDLCPILYNNVQRPTSVGSYLPNQNICGNNSNPEYIYRFIDCDGNAIYN